MKTTYLVKMYNGQGRIIKTAILEATEQTKHRLVLPLMPSNCEEVDFFEQENEVLVQAQ